jgi:hypothetical protein
MDLGLTLGIIGTALTLISLIYAVYITRRSKREKELVYDVLEPAPIADAISKESGYSIKIIYEKPNKVSETVESVFVQYLRFTNFGRVPIKRDDSAATDPIRIEVVGSRVLDIVVASVTRDVCGIALGEVKHERGRTVASINFDFLDYLDGGLIQIVTDSADAVASLHGTVIGMPEGIRKGEKEKTSVIFPDAGCVIPLLIQIATLIAVPFLYRYLTGSWDKAWLLLLPIAALILPIALTMPVVIALLNRSARRFPKPLGPPSWYRWRSSMYDEPPNPKRMRRRNRSARD